MHQKKVVILLSIIAAVAVFLLGTWQLFLRPKQQGKMPSGAGEANVSYPTPAQTVEGIDTSGIGVSFRATQKYFYRNTEKAWALTYLKGVNMGLTVATTDLENPDVPYETYLAWFSQIAEMNANTVKVFTVMPPQFYDAFHDYNESAPSPLYLLQGIWFDENMMYDYDHAFDDGEWILTAFLRGIRETLDITHGNSHETDYGEIKNANYQYDISNYVAGYILGLEWDAGFVKRTNEQTNKAGFEGNYLTTAENATAFETFLCRAGDALITHETETYHTQTPVAFLNWQSNDTLTHTNEPFAEEDMVQVNTENILPTDRYYAGLFAALDVYPYYPEFMNHQPEYQQKKENGEVDSYRAYLKDLMTQYTVPVLIAECGVPTSRGVAHEASNGMDQGGIGEEEQGKYNVRMMQDIAMEGYAGSMLFSWQDEWFKQTWNTIKYSPQDPAMRTPNVQSAEQSYGILAMVPGERDVCYVDGQTEDWRGTTPVITAGKNSVSAMWDEGYLYLNIETNGFNFANDTLYVPIQITGKGSDHTGKEGLTFDGKADFLLQINGKNNTRLLCDAYEDVYAYRYGYMLGAVLWDNTNAVQNSGNYHSIMQFISNEMTLPLTGEVLEAKGYESGLLRYGITDPGQNDYDSLADFYAKGATVELRLPWSLLNVANSTQGVCYQDFQQTGEIGFTTFEEIKIGIGQTGDTVPMASIGYHTKRVSMYHIRLKKSYSILQNAMKTLMVFSENG